MDYIVDIADHKDFGGLGSFEAWERALNDSFGGSWKLLGTGGGTAISVGVEINKSADEIRTALEKWGVTVDGVREG